MKQLIFFFSFLLSIPLISQDERNLQNFSGVDVSGGIYVTLIKSSENRAVVKIVKGDDNAKVITEVENGELEIKFENKKKFNWNNNGSRAEVELYYNGELSSIDVSAGAKVYGEESISTTFMELDASSGASIKIEVEAKEVEVDVSSGASVALSGTAQMMEVDVSSGASFRGAQMSADKVDVSASSGASAKVWAVKSLEANASSGGSVSYKGEPKNLDIDSGKYSGGSVRKN